MEQVIGTKTVTQIRSHAQKFFQKNGLDSIASINAALHYPGGILSFLKSGEKAINPPFPIHVPFPASLTPASLPPDPKRVNRKSDSHQNVRVNSSSKNCGNLPASSSVDDSVPQGNLDYAPEDNLFRDWMVLNGLIPSNQSIQQYVEFTKRQQEQLHLAQLFLLQALGVNVNSEAVKNGTAGTVDTSFSRNHSTTSNCDQSADYAKVFSVLCGIFENDLPITEQTRILKALSPADYDLALLMLHEMSISVVAAQMKKNFTEHVKYYHKNHPQQDNNNLDK
jgi:hypothetical protein